jgi:hypothetical protein
VLKLHGLSQKKRFLHHYYPYNPKTTFYAILYLICTAFTRIV